MYAIPDRYPGAAGLANRPHRASAARTGAGAAPALQRIAGNAATRRILAEAGGLSTLAAGGRTDLIGELQGSAGNAAVERALAGHVSVQRDAAADRKKEEERLAAARASWQSLLGSWAGNKLFELIHKELSPDKLADYASKGLDAGVGATKAIPGFGAGPVVVDQKAIDAVAGAMAGWLAEKAKGWLATPDGKSFTSKVSGFVEGNPAIVVPAALAVAIGAAIAAVAANLDPPEFAKRFELGQGWSVEGGVDVGPLQSLVVQSAKASISKKLGPDLNATLGATYATGAEGKPGTVTPGVTVGGKGTEFAASATLATSGDPIQSAKASLSMRGGTPEAPGARTFSGSATWKPDGAVTLDTSAGLNWSQYKLTTGFTYGSTPGKADSAIGRVSLFNGTKDENVTNDASYDFGKNELTVSASGVRKFKGGEARNAMTVNPDGTRVYTQGFDLDVLRERLKLQLSTDINDKTGTSAGVKVSGVAGPIDYGASVNFGLSDVQLQKLSLHFGYSDPEYFKGFLFDYARTFEGKVATDQLGLTIQQSIKRIAIQIEARTNIKGGEAQSGSLTAIGGIPITDGWMFLAGAKVETAGAKEGGPLAPTVASFGAGVQWEKVPVPVMIWTTPPIAGAPAAVQFGVGVPLPFLDVEGGRKK